MEETKEISSSPCIGAIGVGSGSSGGEEQVPSFGKRKSAPRKLPPELLRTTMPSHEQQPGGGGDRARPSKRIMRKGGYRAPKKSERKFKL